MTVEITRVGPESAGQVLAVVRAAFEARPPLDPPAAALVETEQTIADKLAVHGGLLACLEGRAVGALVLDPVGSTTYLRRFGVTPDAQGHGVAAALIEAAVEAADGSDDLTVVAREELPQTVRFWERQGFREIRRESPNVELRRPLRTHVFQAPDADAMRGLGRSLAGQLTRGDLIVVSGEPGAGKTTFAQGLGAGLGVRGDLTSPTSAIARLHRSLVGGPGLVHVDADRLGALEGLDDLDASLTDAVTVVERGAGLADGLSESRLEVAILRGDAAPDHRGDNGLDPRRVELTPVGPRWHALSFRALG